MKGDVMYSRVTKKTDELTGVEVVKLTDDTGDTFHPYFTQTLINADGKYMVVVSNRTEKWQVYTLRFDDGQMVQISDAEALRPGTPCLDRKNNRVYYFDGRTLKCVQMDNLMEEELLSIPEGFCPTMPSITNDGRYLAFSYVEDIHVISQSSRIYSGMREYMFRKPTSVILRYDTVNRETYVVWGDRCWMSHTNISPVDGNTIMFCHEGNWHLVQRLWVAKVDTDEVYPLIKQKYNLEKVGHEFFTASGRIGAQYSYRSSVHMDFKEALYGDIYVNVDGTDEKRYYYPYSRPMHIQLNHREDMAVGDRAQIRERMDDEKSYISLIRYEGNHANIALLCRHDTSFVDQYSHPHPIYMPNDEYVIYSSDAGGKRNVYMARADWDRCIKSSPNCMYHK